MKKDKYLVMVVVSSYVLKHNHKQKMEYLHFFSKPNHHYLFLKNQVSQAVSITAKTIHFHSMKDLKPVVNKRTLRKHSSLQTILMMNDLLKSPKRQAYSLLRLLIPLSKQKKINRLMKSNKTMICLFLQTMLKNQCQYHSLS